MHVPCDFLLSPYPPVKQAAVQSGTSSSVRLPARFTGSVALRPCHRSSVIPPARFTGLDALKVPVLLYPLLPTGSGQRPCPSHYPKTQPARYGPSHPPPDMEPPETQRNHLPPSHHPQFISALPSTSARFPGRAGSDFCAQRRLCLSDVRWAKKARAGCFASHPGWFYGMGGQFFIFPHSV